VDTKIVPLLVMLAIPVSVAFADSGSMTLQYQILDKINSLLHQKPNFSLDFGKKQVTEYSLIGAISLVVVLAIASSARRKTAKPKGRLG